MGRHGRVAHTRRYNGVAESVNGKVRSIKREAGIFPNGYSFTTAMYLHREELNLPKPRSMSLNG